VLGYRFGRAELFSEAISDLCDLPRGIAPKVTGKHAWADLSSGRNEFTWMKDRPKLGNAELQRTPRCIMPRYAIMTFG